MIQSERCCARCGCRTPPDSPAGLCPNCLLEQGFAASEVDLAPPDPLIATLAHGGSFVPPQPDELAGLYPQFEILELLGYGGMGAVYKARQKSLDRLVALKIIKPDAANDAGFAERFAREARTLAKLNHPNIVSIYDFGQSRPDARGAVPSHYYFVMEYVDGTTLRRLIEGHELTAKQALAIIPPICEALQFAHDDGVVHRDIKPENILVDARGRVKIADFGLAKMLGHASDATHTLTGTHQVMGTPRYMAPEQMEGSRCIDHRADIYSLGVVFYEMLTGELPLGSFEPPSKKAAVDARLDEVVLRALAKEPERRYQHVSDVGTDVESISAIAAQRFVPLDAAPSSFPLSRPQPLAGYQTPEPAAALSHPDVWFWLLGGLLVLVPMFALIGGGMWISQSAWILAMLALPWFGLGLLCVYSLGKPVAKAAFAGAAGAFMGSTGLIGWGIWLEQSALPLLALVAVISAALCGMGIAAAFRGTKSADNGLNVLPIDVAEAAGTQRPSKADKKKEKELRDKVQGVVAGFGIIGFVRCLELFPHLSRALDGIFRRKLPDSPSELLLELTGPVILGAAIAVHHRRGYGLALAGALLCLPTGSCLGVAVGVWAFCVLLDPKVRALFPGSETPAAGYGAVRPEKPSPQFDRTFGKGLPESWTGFWRDANQFPTKTVRIVLRLIQVAGSIAFLSFVFSGLVKTTGEVEWSHRIGLPTPWFTDGPDGSRLNFSAGAWLPISAALLCSYLIWKMETVRTPYPRFWYRPQVWLCLIIMLATLDVGLGVGIKHLATAPLKSKRPEFVPQPDAAGQLPATPERDDP